MHSYKMHTVLFSVMPSLILSFIFNIYPFRFSLSFDFRMAVKNIIIGNKFGILYRFNLEILFKLPEHLSIAHNAGGFR